MVTEAEWDYLRQDRNSALRAIDKYQLTLVYAGLTDTQKAELATYRTCLIKSKTLYLFCSLIIPSNITSQ